MHKSCYNTCLFHASIRVTVIAADNRRDWLTAVIGCISQLNFATQRQIVSQKNMQSVRVYTNPGELD
jgi:hypothetical protein